MLSTAPTSAWTVRLDKTSLPDRALIGGKAWSIARMMSLGLPVPPAFVVTTEACRAFLGKGAFPPGLEGQIHAGIAYLETATGRRFGGPERPLLVSVRSGAPVSMPGMMDTILNLGVTPETEQALVRECGDPAFAHDVHRRFFDLYAGIVLKAHVDLFPPDGDAPSWNALVKQASGEEVPASLDERLLAAVRAVFESWNSRRAKRYREYHGIAHDVGTAITVQAMVFGNLDERSGTGVLFSRNPLTGERAPYGEYLGRAQGEDVVSGKFTPRPLDTLKTALPEAHDALLAAAETLERANGDVQDIEFTVESGKLWLLQSRSAKRAPAAAVRFAVDMAREGAIDKATALRRVTPEQIRLLLAPRLAREPGPEITVLATGEGACPGVGRGVIVTDSDEAERRARSGDHVILARPTTSPEDVHGMLVARAIVTETGGSTSHAAVVSRGLGLPCVVGCGSGKLAGLAGQSVTVEGTRGKVYAGLLDCVTPDQRGDERLSLLSEWARERSPLKVFRPDEAPAGGDIIDLSTVEGGEDPERIGPLLAGHRGAKGGAIASDAGVRAALDAGLDFIVAEPALPAMIAAIHARASGPQQSGEAEQP
jgi:pyruvate, orthophosphate dikinase